MWAFQTWRINGGRGPRGWSWHRLSASRAALGFCPRKRNFLQILGGFAGGRSWVMLQRTQQGSRAVDRECLSHLNSNPAQMISSIPCSNNDFGDIALAFNKFHLKSVLSTQQKQIIGLGLKFLFQIFVEKYLCCNIWMRNIACRKLL